MASRLKELLSEEKNILSIFYTAGIPSLNDTLPLAKALHSSGVKLIEIGFPFSDPLADGEVIQKSSIKAINNGMNLKVLFQQLKELRSKENGVDIPVLLMGYINPLLAYGVRRFVESAAAVGVDGVIIPDLPLEEYLAKYGALFEEYKLEFINFITPTSDEDRIRKIDKLGSAFIYAISSPSVTGSKNADYDKIIYFEKLKRLKLKTPLLIGFGIKDRAAFKEACHYADGAIIGSAFVEIISNSQNPTLAASNFIKGIL